MKNLFKNKTLVITGGTGSFGNAVLQRFLNSDLGELRIFSRDEKKQEDMRLSVRDDRVKFYIGDVRDRSSLNNVLRNSHFVFHAAALKQVPSCEFYPMEAVKTNTIGTANVIAAALDNNVSRLILLSTDKAVYPINAMGISKAMAEKLLVGEARTLSSTETVLCATRYGNVMASRGSVIPLFTNQILNNQNITITDPKMTRFLMSLEDSVDLVMYAFENGAQGDIFVQKSPSTTVEILVHALKEIFSSKQSIETIGTRHGEKLYESLISREEMSRAIDLGKFYKIPADNRDLNYGKFFSEGEETISNLEDYTSHNAVRLDVQQTIKLLSKLDFIRERLDA